MVVAHSAKYKSEPVHAVHDTITGKMIKDGELWKNNISLGITSVTILSGQKTATTTLSAGAGSVLTWYATSSNTTAKLFDLRQNLLTREITVTANANAYGNVTVTIVFIYDGSPGE